MLLRYRAAHHGLLKGVVASCCVAALSCSLSACGSDPAPTSPSNEDGGSACATPGDSFALGLSKTSPGGLKVAIDDANPAPPGLGKNHWKLHITDAAGATVSGATVAIALYMPPPHDHSQPGTVGNASPDGTYVIDDLNLTMPGLFIVTVKVTPAGAAANEQVSFQFCVERKGN